MGIVNFQYREKVFDVVKRVTSDVASFEDEKKSCRLVETVTSGSLNKAGTTGSTMGK